MSLDPPDYSGRAYARICGVVANIVYPGLGLEVSQEGPLYNLRVTCPDGRDTHTGGPLPWRGRYWRLSRYMTDGEIVQTALLAILTALEHEAREVFTYRGQAVFDGHYDIERLVDLRAQPDALKERP